MRPQEIEITEAEFRQLPIKEQNVIIFRSITGQREAQHKLERKVTAHTYIISVLSTALGFAIATFMQHILK